MEFQEYTGKTVDEAVESAKTALGVSTERLEWNLVERESKGFLGIGSKPARIMARKIMTLEDYAEEFLQNVFRTMKMEVTVNIVTDEEEGVMNIDLVGDDMGVLIGKRGQTLDSLQYLVSLVVNNKSEKYYRVKLDTEDYRNRRKETLENLARGIAYKVKKTRKSVSLEPMNPYERRMIHSALQNDKYVATRSEGEEPYRHIVVYLKNPKKFSNYNNHSAKPGYRKGYNKDKYKDADLSSEMAAAKSRNLSEESQM